MMARGKVAEYDDDALVDLLADGGRTYEQIAEELGLSEGYVAKVARGERRPELQRRLLSGRRGMIEEARRVGARWSRALLQRHIKAGLSGDTETARKCREFALMQCCFRREALAAGALEMDPPLVTRMLENLLLYDDAPAPADEADEADADGDTWGDLKDRPPQDAAAIEGLQTGEGLRPETAQDLQCQEVTADPGPAHTPEDDEEDEEAPQRVSGKSTP